MNQVALEAEKRRRRKSKNSNAPGRRIMHSDIVSRKEGVQRISTSAPAEEYRGGFVADIIKNPEYRFSSYHLPIDVATGDYKVVSGCQTILVQFGKIFYSTIKTVKKEEISDRGQLQAGESITVKKGMTVRFGTAQIATDCLLIESGNFEVKQLTPAVSGVTGLQQYHSIRNVSGTDQATRPARSPKTKGEREAQGNRYLASRGVQTTVQQSRSARDRQQKRGNNDVPVVIQGVNPQPIGGGIG
jgi:hypothetical protein